MKKQDNQKKKISRKRMVNKGINKLLYERRLELHYSLFEAAIKLDIYKFQLKLIEKGYLGISKKLKEMFIIKYKLPSDFFDNDLGYPVVIDEVKKTDYSKVKKVIGSWPTRLISFAGLIGFSVMSYFGLTNMQKSNTNVPSFFSTEINKMRDEVNNKGVEGKGGSDFKELIADKYHLYQKPYTFKDNKEANVGIGFFELPENIIHTFYQADYEVGETLVFKTKVKAKFESRCSSGVERIKFITYDDGYENLSISVDYANNKFKYNVVTSTLFGDEEKNNIVKPGTFTYGLITSFFEEEVLNYRLCLKTLFEKSDLNVLDSSGKRISYEDYHSILLKDTKNYEKFCNNANSLTIFGVVFTVSFLALFIASAFLQTKVVSKLTKEGKEADVILDEKPSDYPTRKLRPNLEFRPFIPETLLRLIGLIVLFYSSIGLYFFVNSILNLDIIGSIEIYNRLSIFKSLSSIAIIFIFFTKMDIVISKKNVFLSNYVMFFAGLIYYFLLMIIDFSLSLSQSVYSKVGSDLLSVLPGNFIWGILAFNLLAQLLFNVPEHIKGNKKKEASYHSLAIIPILYLVASMLFTIGEKNWGWNAPLWVKTLFFTKSTSIIIFAILYCLSMFVYKNLVVYAFGEKKSEIIRNGSRYYFIKNLIAAFIIVIIGIVELVVHYTAPNGSAYGFGQNYLIIFAAPFIIFYHPHRGERNALWDFVFMILNGIAMMIGVLLLASSLINYLILI